MSTNDWGTPPRQSPARRSGGSWFRFLIIALLIFVIIRSCNSQQAIQREQGPLPKSEQIPDPLDPRYHPRPLPTENRDRPIDESPATAGPTKTMPTATDEVSEPSTTQTKRGDWIIEEIPANSGDSPQAVPKKPIKEAPKKSAEGDWSLEEVEASTSDKK